MKHLPYQPIFHSTRFGLAVFCALSLITAVLLAATDITPPLLAKQADKSLKVTTRLSQSKLVAGEVSTVYLDVNIKSPRVHTEQTQASDLIVVLDRSGSMSGANKMPYAKAAITDLLARLKDTDRFALVSFADHAIVHSPLVAVSEQQRTQLTAMVRSIQAAGGTNMSAGLDSAVRLLTDSKHINASKVVLLSDGQANQGITDLAGLSRIVAQLTEQESVLSSIGMGLGFNEILMSALADYGMGSYDYLENLSGLSEIFTRMLHATRQIFAANSQLNLTLPDGVELLDAAAYPISKADSNKITIKTGQLLNNQQKNFLLTFKILAQNPGTLSLADMFFAYHVQGENLRQPIAQQPLTLAVIKAEQRQQAIASIDRDVYQQSWAKNNFGRMQKKLSHWIRKGNKDKADQVIRNYRDDVLTAEQQAAVPLLTEAIEKKLNSMETDLSDAFSGDQVKQKVKRNRAAKSILMDSLKEQRTVQKH